MAAKRVVTYRGQTIRLYEQSYAINSEGVVWVKTKPNLGLIKAIIDARIASNGPFSNQFEGQPIAYSWRRRLTLALDDVRDQIPYGWALLIAAVVGSLMTCALAWLIVTFVLTRS